MHNSACSFAFLSLTLTSSLCGRLQESSCKTLLVAGCCSTAWRRICGPREELCIHGRLLGLVSGANVQGKSSTGTAVAAVAHVALVHIPCAMLQIFTKRWRKGVWDLKAIVDSGGMPSSHSALCSVRSSAAPGSLLYALHIALGSLCYPQQQQIDTAS